MNELIGHGGILKALKKMQDSGRLCHAILFVGPESVGKRKIAEGLTKELLGLTADGLPLTTNPDVTFVNRELNDEGELKKNISVKQIRDLRERLGMSSFSGAKKIGIIDEAETLSVGAQSALLKTLEDPIGDALLLLIAKSDHGLLSTILSRCQVVHVPLVPRAEIERAMRSRGMDEDRARSVSGLAAGRPGTAINMATDTEAQAVCETTSNRFFDLLEGNTATMFGELKDMGKMAKRDLEQALDFWEMLMHDMLLLKLGLKEQIAASGKEIELSAHEDMPFQNLTRKITRLQESRRAIQANGNTQLALEHIFI